jgi:hypothetical protein
MVAKVSQIDKPTPGVIVTQKGLPVTWFASWLQQAYRILFNAQLVDTTANRPTAGLYAGQQYFDSTLGKPIWRNAANSGWVDATGGAV